MDYEQLTDYEQLDLFSSSLPRFKIEKHIRLIELFGGIGAQSKALENLVNLGLLPNGFEHYRLIEYDKYPVASYNAIHGTSFEPKDITKIHASDLGIRERERALYHDILFSLSRFVVGWKVERNKKREWNKIGPSMGS